MQDCTGDTPVNTSAPLNIPVVSGAANVTLCSSVLSAWTLLGGWQEGHPACNCRVVGCWCGCLPGARCRLAYGPADAVSYTHLTLPTTPYV